MGIKIQGLSTNELLGGSESTSYVVIHVYVNVHGHPGVIFTYPFLSDPLLRGSKV